MMKKIVKFIISSLSSITKGKYSSSALRLLGYIHDTICRDERTFAYRIHDNLSIDKLLASDVSVDKNVIPSTDKIKVRIIYPSGDSWNNIHTLYDAFKNDDRFQTYVLTVNYPRFIRILNEVGCKYVTYDNYSIIEDKPDILVATYYSSNDKQIAFPDCRKYIGKVFAAIPNAVMNECNTYVHWEYVNRAYQFLEPDYYLVDRLVYNALKGFVPDEKLIEMGNPQFDEIFYEVGRKHPIPQKWGKLMNKKVFLWATDHGVNELHPTNGFTVDLYLRKMIEYFYSHTDIALIFRPHPQFLREMPNAGNFWTDADIVKLKDFFDRSDNLIWDDTFDFCCAYDICDALLVDCNCSITCSALTTGKPICRLLRDDISEWTISPELTDCYYYAKGFSQIIDFINLICEGRDEKNQMRQEGLKQAILHFDGLNGQRMKDFIVLQSSHMIE